LWLLIRFAGIDLIWGIIELRANGNNQHSLRSAK
jgi:hypothetical protein